MLFRRIAIEMPLNLNNPTTPDSMINPERDTQQNPTSLQMPGHGVSRSVAGGGSYLACPSNWDHRPAKFPGRRAGELNDRRWQED
ncbi:hypothetical protein CKAH01_04994 [Colletotrichum kahawae]|uniref:Uncharacterized protein n=1 Tax=Colletotrichum kahawae TaxID=34407 RepID=A0AAE0D7J9_COLKA|nr:hypothetical protein CKAH01_04994 [Colletotrichum kahawae]